MQAQVFAGVGEYAVTSGNCVSGGPGLGRESGLGGCWAAVRGGPAGGDCVSTVRLRLDKAPGSAGGYLQFALGAYSLPLKPTADPMTPAGVTFHLGSGRVVRAGGVDEISLWKV